MAMSGGLQPWPKYEQVVAEPCWPMKLSLGGGVAVLETPVPEPPFTPPELLMTLAGPLPLGHFGDSPSSAEVEAPCTPLPVGDNT